MQLIYSLLFFVALTVSINCEDVKNENCMFPCPRHYMPICVITRNGEHRIFDNECVMRQKSCESGYVFTRTELGNCLARSSENHTKLCPKICPDIYNPVCGFDGKQHRLFTNQCQFLAVNCNNEKKWTRTRSEQCSYLRN